MIRFAVFVAFLVAASTTYADPAATRQEAKRLRDEGTEAMRVSDFAHAVDCFQRAYELYPSPNLRFNIGVALDKLGRVPQAVDAFEEFLEATAGGADEAHRFAGARLAALTPQVARLELTVDPASAGATVRVDGEHVRWPRPGGIPVAPGERRVRAEQRGWAPVEQQVTATVAAPVALTLRLAAAPPDPPAPRPALVRAAPAAAPPRTPLYRRWWVWTAASAATVAVALGVGLGIGLSNSGFSPTQSPF
jgi:hypothetical protein